MAALLVHPADRDHPGVRGRVTRQVLRIFRPVARGGDQHHPFGQRALDGLRQFGAGNCGQGQVDHVGALRDRPVDGRGDLRGELRVVYRAELRQNPDRQDAGGRGDAAEGDDSALPARDDAGDQRAVPGLVALALPGRQAVEVATLEHLPLEQRVGGGHSGVDHGHRDPGAPGQRPRRGRLQAAERPRHLGQAVGAGGTAEGRRGGRGGGCHQAGAEQDRQRSTEDAAKGTAGRGRAQRRAFAHPQRLPP
ncbi:hypothetical protein PSN01_03047 [Micromonospora saelicesensis]|nr:hypothetical protein PSN01_03047 [Micromonospora saelicesensis]